MTSETDHPRQRTVAELLAAHGDVAPAAGRRRRRRAEDGPDEVGSTGGQPTYPPPGNDYGPGPERPRDDRHAAAPDRRILREPVPVDEPPRRPAPEVRRPAAFDTPRDAPTDRMPRVPPRAPAPPAPPPAPSGAEAWGRPPAGRRPDDGGPPTQAGAALDDDYADDEYDDDDYADDEYDDENDYDDGDYAGRDTGPGRTVALRAGRDDDGFDRDAGIDEDIDHLRDDDFEDEDEDEPARSRGLAGSTARTQSWAAMVAQWVVGAIGGAAVWVAFRFLWRDLTVVAAVAALAVTVGLVFAVRHLLRTTDMRTTVYAVGVGLLLTVSPVVLILLGK